ncbi:accessory Sec system protein Asp3, partial [Staphylococcus aureus]
MMIHLPLQVGLLIFTTLFWKTSLGEFNMLKNKTFKVTWNYISQTTFMYGS